MDTTKQKIFIHVGLGKTATTTIQYLLHHNNFENIYVPKTGLNNEYLQHLGLLDIRCWTNLLIEIQKIKNKDFVLSSEMFIYSAINNETNLNIIKSMFHCYDVHIIYSIRNIKELMISSYLQHIKDLIIFESNIPKSHWKFDKWLEWHFQSKSSFNFNLLINKFENVFNVKNIHVLTYSKHIIEEFFHLLGIESKHFSSVGTLNKSLKFTDSLFIVDNLFINEDCSNKKLSNKIKTIVETSESKKIVVNDSDHMIVNYINSVINQDLANFCSKYKLNTDVLTYIDKTKQY